MIIRSLIGEEYEPSVTFLRSQCVRSCDDIIEIITSQTVEYRTWCRGDHRYFLLPILPTVECSWEIMFHIPYRDGIEHSRCAPSIPFSVCQEFECRILGYPCQSACTADQSSSITDGECQST